MRKANLNISIADGSIIKAKLKGVWKRTATGNPIYAYICPEFDKDLILLGSLTDARFDIVFSKSYVTILDNEQVISKAKKINGVYRIDELNIVNNVGTAKTATTKTLKEWHLCFNHLNCTDILKLKHHDMVNDLNIVNQTKKVECESCLLTKSHKRTYKDSKTIQVTRPGEQIHIDTCYIGTPSLGKSTYLLTITDNFSRYSWVFPIKQKNDAIKWIEDFMKYVQTHTGRNVQYNTCNPTTSFSLTTKSTVYANNMGLIRKQQRHTPLSKMEW